MLGCFCFCFCSSLPSGFGLSRAWARLHPRAPPDTRKALLYTANVNPTKNPAEAGFSA